MKPIHWALVINLGFAVACGGSSSSGGSTGGASGSSHFDKAKFASACSALCQKENTCNNAGIDCTGNCNATADQVAQAFAQSGANTGSCDIDRLETAEQDCAAGTCDALSSCEKMLDQICPKM